MEWIKSSCWVRLTDLLPSLHTWHNSGNEKRRTGPFHSSPSGNCHSHWANGYVAVWLSAFLCNLWVFCLSSGVETPNRTSDSIINPEHLLFSPRKKKKKGKVRPGIRNDSWKRQGASHQTLLRVRKVTEDINLNGRHRTKWLPPSLLCAQQT